MYSFLNSYLLLSYADISLEEDKFHICVLPIEETYTSLVEYLKKKRLISKRKLQKELQKELKTPNFLLILSPTMSLIQCNTKTG